ncbi:MAG: DUF4402 domain-containing protein [Bacteroidia bacterium]
MIVLFTAVWNSAKAQQPRSGAYYSQDVTVRATAAITDNLSLLTMRDMTLTETGAVEGVIIVPPSTSPYSGMMRINGRPGRQIRITYLSSETLIEEGGSGGVVKANYRISGFETDNQSASVLLDIGEAVVRIGPEGTYHIWLGAEIDISNATPGAYTSDFIIELEGSN